MQYLGVQSNQASSAASGAVLDTRIIHSLDKGLQVLELVAATSGDVALSDLTLRLRWDKSSVFRILTTLIRRGYVEQDRATRRYRLGFHVLHLSQLLFRALDLPQMAREVLTRLAHDTGEAAHLAMMRQHECVIIAQRESPERVAVNANVGTVEPLHSTALGKAMLMQMTDEAADRVLQHIELPQRTPNTITSRQWLLESVRKSRRLGYALDDEEATLGVRCIAVPVVVPGAQQLYAIGISGPSSRVVAGRIPMLAGHVMSATADLVRLFEPPAVPEPSASKSLAAPAGSLG